MLIDPDLFYTLFTLAKLGAIKKTIKLSTRILGELMGVSQQTASRRLAVCAKQKLLTRVHTPKGQEIHITELGEKELMKYFTGLKYVFENPPHKYNMTGRVVRGLGEGAYYVKMYADRFKEKLGFEPYPGTLNVKIEKTAELNQLLAILQNNAIIIEGFEANNRTFGRVRCCIVSIEDKISGAIVSAERTHHTEDTTEIIAAVNLRETLGLKDGDLLRFTVILHEF